MKLDTDVLSLLPPWFREIGEFQEIAKTEQEQLEQLAKAVQTTQGNLFFQKMDRGAVEEWEKIFHIIPNPKMETLEFRRLRLLNRISIRPPFTLGFLYQKLDELIGTGKWTVEVDYDQYTLYVESAAENQSYAQEIAVTMEAIKPCHIVYVNRPYLREGVGIGEQVHLIQQIYHYRLGSWGLGVSPFASEEDKGVIKTPSQKSIQTQLLTQTAAFWEEAVASARINGTVLISDIAKRSEETASVITYTVEESQAQTVTKIELLDAEGRVLTSSGVYVPILGSAEFKHILFAKEAV